MRLFPLAVLVSASALAFVLPGAAAASPRFPSAGPESEACPVGHIILNVRYTCAAEFTLRAKNGYRITVSADPAGSGPGDIELTAESPNASAVYISSGPLTSNGLIKASFGRLGKLSLRFHPSGKVRRVKVPKTCLTDRPPLVTSQLGTFGGTFSFRGEDGYTSVSAHRVAGGVGDPLANTTKKLDCEIHESDAEREHERKAAILIVADRAAGVSFEAAPGFGPTFQLAPPAGPVIPKTDRYIFLATAFERAEGMRIFRLVGALGSAGEDFIFDDTLTSAAVTPPPPFTGTGNFLRNAGGSSTWTGPLSVPFPGLGTIELAEGRFKGSWQLWERFCNRPKRKYFVDPISRVSGSSC